MPSPTRHRSRSGSSERKATQWRARKERRSDDDADQVRSSRRHRDDSRENRRRSRDRYRGRDRRSPARDRRSPARDRRSPERDGQARDRHRDRYLERQRSSSPQRPRDRRHSPSSSRRTRTQSRDRSASPRPRRSRGALPSQNDSFNEQRQIENGGPPLPEKQKPNFKPTGILAKEANTVAGTTTVLKYHEPPEARKPKDQWRLYVFKKKDLIDTIHLHQRSVWLVGRDQHVTDLFVEHPSISKQHAVIQFRYITTTNEFGDRLSRIKPYLIDLESSNGTSLNGKKIESSRYVELVDGDVIKYGDSEREYVAMLPPAEKK